jgi:hypothetical protein
MENEDLMNYPGHNAQGYTSNNESYVYNQAFMLTRIDAEPLVKNVQDYLESKQTSIYETKDGKLLEKTTVIGIPLANPEGIRRICNILRMRINSQVVQGNLKENHYWDLVIRARKELTNAVIKNCYVWEINDSDIDSIISDVSHLVEIYLTRPINNEERKSYEKQVQAKEIIQTEQRPSRLGGFFRR